MRLVGLCGYAGSGKDEAAKALTAIGWQRVAFADAVREVALTIDPILDWSTVSQNELRLSQVVKYSGWHEAKRRFPEIRRLLQVIGTEAGRNILGPNTWVDAALRKASGDTVFTDVRFENEVAAIRERNGILVRITRPGVGPVNGHASETAIDSIAPDFTIDNCEDAAALHRALLEVVELATWRGEVELPPFTVSDVLLKAP